MKDYYTAPEVADIFGVKVLTVYRWINAGILPATKAGQWQITWDGIQIAIDKLRMHGKYYSPQEQENMYI